MGILEVALATALFPLEIWTVQKIDGSTIVIVSPGSRSVKIRFGNVYVTSVLLNWRETATVSPGKASPLTYAVRHSVQLSGVDSQLTLMNVSTYVKGVGT